MVSITGRKFLIVEDNSDLCDSLKEAIEAKGGFVYTAATGEAAWDILEKNQVDAVIIDMLIPGILGIDLIPKATAQAAAIVAITGNASFDANSIYTRGAHVLIRKPFSIADVIEATVRHFPPEMSAKNQVERLSEREFEVLSLIRQGCESAQISAILGISPHTVAFHRKSIRRKHRQLSFIEICSLYFR